MWYGKNYRDLEEELCEDPCVVIVKERDCNCVENLKHQLETARLKMELEEYFKNFVDEEDL